MEQRDLFLDEFRGNTIGTTNTTSTNQEIFQNQVLRPILKLQNNILVASFKNYILSSKKDFSTLSLQKQLDAIDNIVHKDTSFRNTLKGMIIGLFTEKEYADYTKNSSEINRRMMTMLIERLKSQIDQIKNKDNS